MSSKKILFIFCIISLYSQRAYSQHYQNGKFGINVGVVLAIGTHIDRFGANINAFYITKHFQVNPELRLYFNTKNLGPDKQSVEGVAGLGIVYGYGKRNLNENLFYSLISNQTKWNNSFGYAYLFYFNDIETSQKTGTISIQVSEFSFIAENDLFSGTPKLDRYRTGAFLFQYQKDRIQFAINSTLFTGQMGERITDENYPFVGVYENTVGGKYTKFSHGLLSAQFKYAGEFYQTYQANIGIDSERVRHAIQNRFVHDILIGHGINAHVPMLDDKGEQYLFKDGQKVKPIQFYLNGYSNPSIFY